MNALLHYVRRLVELPPQDAARKALELVAYRSRRRWRKWTDRRGPDLTRDRVFARRLGIDPEAMVSTGLLAGAECVLPVRWTALRADASDVAELRAAALPVLDHRFDLLGSGPIRVDYRLEAPGLEGHRYRMPPGEAAERAQRAAMEALLPGSADGYAPIDWQVDFKSGYRWSETMWSMDLPYGHLAGVDVKVPWELSRFQHLGALGLLHRLDPGGSEARAAPAEFVSQVTDWIAANPVRRGVNWLCTMDVAIRAVNWLMALELFRDAEEVTPRFRWLLAKSMYAHGLHIEGHLEYHPRATGNHYLSNVVGLLCIAAALPEVSESDRWLAWSIQELASEMDRQVLPDGVDHEGSSGYHFLVAELFFVGTAAALRAAALRRDRVRAVPAHRIPHPGAPRYRGGEGLRLETSGLFPAEYFDRLLGMAEFGAAITNPGGRIPLYGDHDSGRLYRLWPSVGESARDGAGEGTREDFRDRRGVAALAGRLFHRPDLARIGDAFEAEAELLLGDADPGAAVESVRALRSSGAGTSAHIVWARPDGEVPDGLSVFPHGGIAVLRLGSVHVTITLGSVPEGASGGHYHNDLLSYELHWDGTDLVVDPGTYLYTPAPHLRNRFRSVRSHNTVAVADIEQRAWPDSTRHLFAVLEDAEVDVLNVATSSFTARARYRGVVHERRWSWEPGRLTIEDHVTAPSPAALIHHFGPGVDVEQQPDRDGSAACFLLRGAGAAARLRMEGVGRTVVAPSEYAPAYGMRVPIRAVLAELVANRSSTSFIFLPRNRRQGE